MRIKARKLTFCLPIHEKGPGREEDAMTPSVRFGGHIIRHGSFGTMNGSMDQRHVMATIALTSTSTACSLVVRLESGRWKFNHDAELMVPSAVKIASFVGVTQPLKAESPGGCSGTRLTAIR